MADLGSVFKIPTKAQIAYLKLDGSISETHSRSAKITENEVEDGSVISDHVRLSPISLTMSCIISDVPVSLLGLGVSQDDFLGAAKEYVGGKKNAFEGLAKNPTRTPQEAWKYLEQTWKDRTPFSVVTSLQRYENMIITDLTAPRSAENGKSLIFDIQMREIKIAKSSVVTVAAIKTKGADGAASKTDLGTQAGKEASGEQTDNASIALKLARKIGIPL